MTCNPESKTTPAKNNVSSAISEPHTAPPTKPHTEPHTSTHNHTEPATALHKKPPTYPQTGPHIAPRIHPDTSTQCGSQFDNRPTLRHSWNSLRLSSIFSLISVLLFIVPLITTGKYYPLLPLVQGFFVIAAGLLVAWHASKARGTRNEDLDYMPLIHI